ncbi:hypothetical protein PM082_024418 [Marasmius tenuissimus]|nr:hypothetical protein PM082_024418 [Marasmius tenuissimus]
MGVVSHNICLVSTTRTSAIDTPAGPQKQNARSENIKEAWWQATNTLPLCWGNRRSHDGMKWRALTYQQQKMYPTCTQSS